VAQRARPPKQPWRRMQLTAQRKQVTSPRARGRPRG
jgi:hypothetical protein